MIPGLSEILLLQERVTAVAKLCGVEKVDTFSCDAEGNVLVHWTRDYREAGLGHYTHTFPYRYLGMSEEDILADLARLRGLDAAVKAVEDAEYALWYANNEWSAGRGGPSYKAQDALWLAQAALVEFQGGVS